MFLGAGLEHRRDAPVALATLRRRDHPPIADLDALVVVGEKDGPDVKHSQRWTDGRHPVTAGAEHRPLQLRTLEGPTGDGDDVARSGGTAAEPTRLENHVEEELGL